jgi:hypothetical protein
VILFFQQNNVLFRKQIYFESDGFKGRMNEGFANMELLFNTGKKNRVIVSVASETNLRESVSLVKADFKELVQKRIQIKRNFSLMKRMVLGLEDFAAILLLAGFVWLLITEIRYWFIFSIPVVLVLGFHLFIVKSLQDRLNEKKIFLSSLVYLLARPVISTYHRAALAIYMQRNRWI